MKKISGIITAVALLLVAPVKARAADPPLHVDPSLKECSVQFAPTLTQDAFERFVREFGSVSAFKQGAPPTTLGQWGVSIGIEMISFTVDDKSAAWNDTFAHPDAGHELGSRQTFPKLKLRIGVTDNIDVGAFYTRAKDANYGWLGLDGKYRLLTQSENMPVTFALRGAYTKTRYVSDMDMHAFTADVSVERRVWQILRPYMGLGSDVVFARETSDAVDLSSESLIVPHLFAGFETTFWRHVSLGAEFTLGTLQSVQVQVAAVF
ncbi:MAG TPA: hypothetical protein VJ161_08610 [Geobacteraceae bacterium]|nr:hypothetical protein [Geobacteraceae bacterium]